MSACIARAVADGGYSVVYETAVHLFQRLEEAKFSDSQEARHRAEKYTACDLLLIDDLGTELTTQFVSSALYTVLNDRLLAGRPTVVSTNLQSDEIALRYSPQIASRLLGSYRLVAFVAGTSACRRLPGNNTISMNTDKKGRSMCCGPELCWINPPRKAAERSDGRA